MSTTVTKPKKTAAKKKSSAKQDTTKAFRFDVGTSKDSIKTSILNHLRYTLARHPENATKDEWWTATCYAVRDRMLDRFMKTQGTHHKKKVRRAYYLSLEYLMGRLLVNNLHNAGMFEPTREALAELGQDFSEIADEEADMGLGNGGLGRLAACFLDSLATLDLPAVGYGIHYEFGLFRQEFRDGYQIEHPDVWMEKGCPWEVMRPNFAQDVHLYGRVEHRMDDKGVFSPVWVDTRVIEGVPSDIGIVGYGAETVNFLRLWDSKSTQEFEAGDLMHAVHFGQFDHVLIVGYDPDLKSGGGCDDESVGLRRPFASLFVKLFDHQLPHVVEGAVDFCPLDFAEGERSFAVLSKFLVCRPAKLGPQSRAQAKFGVQLGMHIEGEILITEGFAEQGVDVLCQPEIAVRVHDDLGLRHRG